MGFRLVTRAADLLQDPAEVAEVCRAYLRATVVSNRLTMRAARRAGKPIPALYASGVKYRREPEAWRGVEHFDGVLTCLQRGWMDCDDAVAWRVAELLEHGERNVRIKIYWRPPRNGRTVFHCEVVRGNGHVEDVCRFLGL